MSRERDPSRIKKLIIHCAATPNGQWFNARHIDFWHGKRGFKRSPALMKYQQPRLSHVGYHYVIGLKGSIESCRDLVETGAHARGHNYNSIGTCLIGTDKFTKQQWQALKEHVQALQNSFPNIEIIGHYQVNPHKTCCGFNVQDWLANDMQPLPIHLLT